MALLEELALISELFNGYHTHGSPCDECDLTIPEDEPQTSATVFVNAGTPRAGAILFVICLACKDADNLTVIRKRAEGSLTFSDDRKQFLRFISPEAIPYVPELLTAKKEMVS
jgi:hypothetical protein